MVDVVVGLFGGAAASLAATLVFVFDGSVRFPASLAVARILRTEPTERYYVGFVSTFAYGVPAGVAYVRVFSRMPLLPVTSLLGSVVYAIVWGSILAGLLLLVVGPYRESGYDRYLLAAHLLYGLILAGFVMIGPTDPTATAGPVGGY